MKFLKVLHFKSESRVGYLSNNRFLVLKNNKVGFVDINGEIVIPLIYDKYTHNDFEEGLCVVYKDGKAGMIDTEGNVIIPFEYKKLNDCREGLILATNEKMQNGYIDRNNMVVVPFGKYITCEDFHCGLAKVYSREHGFVYIDTNGEVLEIKV